MMDPARPQCDRRAASAPGWQGEHFIVPLVGDRVERCLDLYLTHQPGGPEFRALDVGCGGQPFRATLEQRGAIYTSMDVAPASGVTVDHAGAIDEPLSDRMKAAGLFDLVLCTEVLEHVAHWEVAFRNLAALTRPGGWLIVTCPFFYCLHEEPFDYWRPTAHALRKYAEANGFGVMHSESAGTGWDVLGTLLAATVPVAENHTIRSRVGAALVRFCVRISLAFLRRGWLQALVRLDGSFYLSNVMVMERHRD